LTNTTFLDKLARHRGRHVFVSIHGIDRHFSSSQSSTDPLSSGGVDRSLYYLKGIFIVPMSDEADPLQLSMIGINPATA
jgi:hypothetical protein